MILSRALIPLNGRIGFALAIWAFKITSPLALTTMVVERSAKSNLTGSLSPNSEKSVVPDTVNVGFFKKLLSLINTDLVTTPSIAVPLRAGIKNDGLSSLTLS